MSDKITIKLTYSRREILAYAQKAKDLGGELLQVRRLLDEVYPAWRMDGRTACMVELMFRDEDDEFYPLFAEKLAELDARR